MICELCGAPEAAEEGAVVLCGVCAAGVAGAVEDAPHWQCLHGAVWSENPGAKLAAAQILIKLEAPWAEEVLASGALEEDLIDQARSGLALDVVHRDANGAVLSAGDTVVLVKDLPVKGAGFTAKRGTAVRGISLVAENAGHIEGRVEGQRIVILTEFVKRQG